MVFGKPFLLCLRQDELLQSYEDKTRRIVCALLQIYYKAPISQWEQTFPSKQWNCSSEVPQNFAESGNRPLPGPRVSSYFRGRLGARWRRKIPPETKFYEGEEPGAFVILQPLGN